jgi:hypothetical protein
MSDSEHVNVSDTDSSIEQSTWICPECVHVEAARTSDMMRNIAPHRLTKVLLYVVENLNEHAVSRIGAGWLADVDLHN